MAGRSQATRRASGEIAAHAGRWTSIWQQNTSPVRGRAVRAAADSQRQRRQRAARRRAAGRRVGGRAVPPAGVRGRGDRDGRPSDGLCRVARRWPAPPTVLVYGHYDVQPPDPLDEWISPPFEPTVRDGNLYARGATDDKGQMLTHVKSAEAWIATAGQAAGATEVPDRGRRGGRQRATSSRSSPSNAERLACDCVVISDSCAVRPRPAGDHLRPARHRLLRAAADRARSGICTPARSAAR